jgi:type I restriction enzyme S subunit
VAAAGIRGSDLRKLAVPFPSLATQEAIVDILGTLDDKIFLNSNIATTCDALAGSTFERVLRESRIAEDVPLGRVAKINFRNVKPVPDGRLVYIDIGSVATGCIEWPTVSRWEDAPGRARRGVASGDIIWSTVRPNRQSYALVLENDQNIVASTGFVVITPVNLGPALLYEAVRRQEFVDYLVSVAEGSAYPAVRPDKFEVARIPEIPEESARRFEVEAIALRRRENLARRESRTLSRLRDTLLPKLMSGEIRVRDAEKVVEDVT